MNLMKFYTLIRENRRLFFLTALFFLQSFAHGSSYWGGYKGYGEPVTVYDARLLGMGAASIAVSGSGSAIFNNPAGLNLIERKEIQGTFDIMSVQESRKNPMHTSYFTGLEMTYVHNAPLYYNLGFLSFVMPAGKTKRFSFGLGRRREYDFSYRYNEDIEDSYGNIIGKTTVASSGSVYAYSGSAALKLSNWFFLGGTFNYLEGKKDYEDKLVYHETADHLEVNNGWKDTGDILNTNNNRLSGSNFTLGAMFNRERFRMGLTYTAAAVMTNKWSNFSRVTNSPDSADDCAGLLSGENKWKYPGRYGAGFSYGYSNEFKSLVTAEVILTRWSQFRENQNSILYYKDIYEFHCGIEHYLNKNLPLRAGFYVRPVYENKEILPIVFTGGFSIKAGRLHFDIGGEFSNVRYKADAFSSAARDQVDESVSRILISTRLGF